MRIAILIGITKFDNCDDLPGCENDVIAIHDVISKSNQFDEIKLFKNRIESNSLKPELAEYFSDLKGKSIDEILFYFSGHGNFYNKEFYYVLSDFDENSRKQTSLQNSEIDNLIKSTKPRMVTKIIDACQSGVTYIKGENSIEKYYHKTAENFDKCYFLHSSMTSQFSYQDDQLSDFTKSFLSSLRVKNKSNIRYKDIIDYISDEFEKSTEQTPFFVTQADYTETFLKSSKEINSIIDKYVPIQKVIDVKKKEDTIPERKELTYIEKIKLEAKQYSSQEETKNLIEKIKNIIEESSLKTNLNELYSIEFNFEHNTLHLPKGISIGGWLEDNSHNYFAKPYYKITNHKEEIAPSIYGSLMGRMGQNRFVTREQKDLDGFQTTSELPHSYALIKYLPKYPNIKQYGLFLTYLVSKKDIKIFYAFTDYKERNWTNKSVNLNFKWSSSDFKIIEENKILEFIKTLVKEIELNIKSRLETKSEQEK